MPALTVKCAVEAKPALQLVAAAAGLAGSAVAFTAPEGSSALSAATKAGENIQGLNPVARGIVQAAAKEVSDALLGASAEDQAAVAEWLTYCNTELSGVVTDQKLFRVNEHLQSRTFLTLERMTLADLLVFSRLSAAVAALPAAQTDQLCNLLRWFDMVQKSPAARPLFPPVAVAKPRLNTSPLAAAQPEQASAKSSSSGASSATREAAPAQKGVPGKPGKEAGKEAGKGAGKGAEAAAAKPQAADSGASAEGGKGKKEKKEKAPPPPKAEVEVSVRMADIRVGTITKVWRHPNAEALYCEEIDLGEDKPRQVVSGLVKFVPEAGMLNRRVVVVCNLKPAKMRDVMSYGMVLCAANSAHDQVEPIAPPEGVPNGERITFEGYEGEPEEVLNPKKKVWEKIAPDLVTDESGVAKYKGAAFMTSKGACTSKLASGTVG
eukprot:jgi/Tetstr1/446986/TSEL_034444.t1